MMYCRFFNNNNKLLLVLLNAYCALFLISSNNNNLFVSGIRILPKVDEQHSHQQPQRLDDEHRSLLSSHFETHNNKRKLITNPDEHLVTNLPLLDEGTFSTKHWAGLVPASPSNDKYFFYWLFEPDNVGSTPQEDIPLIIWLNGGPGCSSMDGLFIENGPLQLINGGEVHGWKIISNEYSWHKSPAYTVYIDQPVGTGLSYTTSKTYPRNDLEVNIDFYYFLQEFFKLHSDKFMKFSSENQSKILNRPLYYTGESHAGHYIPSIMSYIVDRNKDISNKIVETDHDIVIPLSGAGIGNGWVDPYHQYAGATAAYGASLIDLAQKNSLDEKEKKCQAAINQKDYRNGICFELLDNIIHTSFGSNSPYTVSSYDARQIESKHSGRTFPPGHKDIESYLGGAKTQPGLPNMSSDLTSNVLKAIHATDSWNAGQRYRECTDPPYNALSHQDGLGVVPDVIKLLELPEGDNYGHGKIKLLFFNGVWDLICNHVGNEIMLEQLNWSNKDAWIKASRYAWKSNTRVERLKKDGKTETDIAGYVKEYQNLLFLKVLNSGHMVPLDVPDVAFDMIQTFVYSKSFDSSKQGLDRSISHDNDQSNCPICPTPVHCPTVDEFREQVFGKDGDPSKTATSTSSLNTNDNDDTKNGQVLTFIVAHSWIGALLCVFVFVIVLFVLRGRRVRLRRERSPMDSGDFEMNRGGKVYRDVPIDVHDDGPGTNGHNNGNSLADDSLDDDDVSDHSSRASSSGRLA